MSISPTDCFWVKEFLGSSGTAGFFLYAMRWSFVALLKSTGSDDKFWAGVLLCHMHVWNRICQDKQNVTSFELYGGRKLSVKKFLELKFIEVSPDNLKEN